MSKIHSLINSLFLCNGNNQNLWKELKIIIKNFNDQIDYFCSIMKNRINTRNKQEILLSLNILDFVVDSGSPLLWTKIDDIKFLSCIINLIENNTDQDIKNAALYLIQKWSYKFENYPSIRNCKSHFLKYNNNFFTNNIQNSSKISLPNNNIINKNMNNINNNISKNNNVNNNINNINNNIAMNNNINNNLNINKWNNNNNFINNNNNFINNNNNFINNNNNFINNNKNNQINNNILRQSRIPSNPDDYLKDINLDLNINNFDKKYHRLINKLNDWTLSIQEINILINNNLNGQNNLKIKNLIDDLKIGKEQLVKTIQGSKLKNEKLTEISLNICEDMIMTLERGEKSLKGENPGPFLSSFSRDNNPNLNKNNNNPKEVCPNIEEKIENLGFGDTIVSKYLDDGENNENNDFNHLSGLFQKENNTMNLDIAQSTDVYLNKNNDFFMNMSNSNLNLSVENVNKYKDFDQVLDKNKNNIFNKQDNINENKIENLKINDNKNILINNSNQSKIVDNNNIKRIAKSGFSEKENLNEHFYQSQRFPSSHMNLISK